MTSVSCAEEAEEPSIARKSMPLLSVAFEQQLPQSVRLEVGDSVSQGSADSTGVDVAKDPSKLGGAANNSPFHSNSPSNGGEVIATQTDDSISRMTLNSTDSKKLEESVNDQQIPPHVSKSKNARFHKLFKSVPIDEYPVDSYSCAFKGDILLQGMMYVSQNWLCFYSKIRARGRLLEIPLDKVISITREKLALIIPNAIGIQTADQKYVFGSFMSRDNTYKLLVTLWKHSQDSSDSNTKENEISIFEDFAAKTGRRSLVQACEDNSADVSGESDTTEDEMQDADFMSVEPGQAPPGASRLQNGSGHHHHHHDNRRLSDPSAQQNGMDCRRLFAALSIFSGKLQKVPRTNLLLAVCSVLVVFLVLSALGLTYKILLLQTRLEMSHLWSPSRQHSFREETMGSIYTLQSRAHMATVNQLHDVLKANIQLLEQVHQSLKSLQGPPVQQECQTK